jgi:hypothetical protein
MPCAPELARSPFHPSRLSLSFFAAWQVIGASSSSSFHLP